MLRQKKKFKLFPFLPINKIAVLPLEQQGLGRVFSEKDTASRQTQL